jgi:hypothetical protein
MARARDLRTYLWANSESQQASCHRKWHHTQKLSSGRGRLGVHTEGCEGGEAGSAGLGDPRSLEISRIKKKRQFNFFQPNYLSSCHLVCYDIKSLFKWEQDPNLDCFWCTTSSDWDSLLNQTIQARVPMMPTLAQSGKRVFEGPLCAILDLWLLLFAVMVDCVCQLNWIMRSSDIWLGTFWTFLMGCFWWDYKLHR